MIRAAVMARIGPYGSTYRRGWLTGGDLFCHLCWFFCWIVEDGFKSCFGTLSGLVEPRVLCRKGVGGETPSPGKRENKRNGSLGVRSPNWSTSSITVRKSERSKQASGELNGSSAMYVTEQDNGKGRSRPLLVFIAALMINRSGRGSWNWSVRGEIL